MDNIKQEDIEDICFNVSKNIILPKFKNLSEDDINYKNGSDLVTVADIEAEKELKKNLLKIIPSSNFIGEEEYSRNENILNFYNEDAYCWTVDPIDGTTNFANGRDKFAIMIALTFKEKILRSWIYKPLEKIMCSAIVNEGAYINNKKIVTKFLNVNMQFLGWLPESKAIAGSVVARKPAVLQKSLEPVLQKNFAEIASNLEKIEAVNSSGVKFFNNK